MNRGFWKGMLIACILMLVVLAGSIPYTETDSANFVIIQLAAAHLIVAMLVLSAFLYFDWDPIRKLFDRR